MVELLVVCWLRINLFYKTSSKEFPALPLPLQTLVKVTYVYRRRRIYLALSKLKDIKLSLDMLPLLPPNFT